jgi:uncharacterized membrane protein (DUF2068 family)
VDWNLVACSRGHRTYAPDEVELHDHLRVATPVGEAWRCLRCGTFVPGPAGAKGPAQDAPVPLRGAELRDAIVLRALAVDRGLRAILVFFVAYGVYRFRADQDAVRRAVAEDLPLLQQLASSVHWNIADSTLMHTATSVLGASRGTLLWAIVALIAYGAVQLAEAVGLWLLKRWGEYLSAVATSVFIPVEVFELVERLTWVRVAALLINIGAVAYLVLRKRLFGVRGGRRAYDAERHTEALFQVELAAGETISRPVR